MKIDPFIIIKQKEINLNQIEFTLNTRKWCQMSYPQHPKGCPNYGKSQYCPPNAPYYINKIKHFERFQLIWAEFDFKQYKIEMKKIHPNWTEKQLGNLLYWQSQIKKRLKEYIQRINPSLILACGSGFKTYSMEAVGINVIKTLYNVDIPIEIKPKQIIRLVCLIGWKKEKNTLKKYF